MTGMMLYLIEGKFSFIADKLVNRAAKYARFADKVPFNNTNQTKRATSFIFEQCSSSLLLF
ncbi:hypothetical protein ACQKNC_17740 [Lysinibacillus sp. NPDC094177]|uniref:hypothetical protein n=1 Tax=Lysinibacillus sp. NPDC094177 TaxID=3390580 RepID=UPI003CFD6C0B